jgi:hypothetical protein
LSAPFTASIRAMCASTTSSDETSPRAMRLANPVAENDVSAGAS